MSNSKYTPLPDGDYVGEILSVSTSKADEGYTMVDCPTRVIGGDFDGEVIPKRYHLKNEGVANLLKREFTQIGVPIADKKEFARKKDAAVGIVVAIKAQTKEDGWVSYYFKKAVKKAANDTKETEQGVEAKEIDIDW
jgi:hypothetical protein